jgi:ribose transport system substrate-binding protein
MLTHPANPRPRGAFGVLAVCLMTLAGCSSHAPAPAADRQVTLVVANTELNFAKQMAQGFTAGVEEVGGVHARITGPAIVDGARQVQLFREATRTTPAGVAVFTLSPSLFTQPLAQAAADGIPLTAVDNPPPRGSGVDLFIGNDNRELGRLLADQVIAQLPPNASGTVVIGTTSPGVPVLDQRAQGMRAELTTKRPGLTVLGPLDTKQDVAANLAAWTLIVKANPHAIAFLGTGDADGWNLASIRNNLEAHWIAGAYDLDPRSLDAVKKGDLLLISPEHFVKGAIAGRLHAQRIITGIPMPQGWIYTPGLAITSHNVDEIIARQASTTTERAWFAPEINNIITHLPNYLRPLGAA